MNHPRPVGPNGAYLTAFLQDARPARSAEIPAIVVVPGGGYMTLSPGEGEPVALAYAEKGFHAFVLHYSVGAAATFAEALEDAEAAIADIRLHADEWGIAPHRIAVIGFSAGGHLVASLATRGSNRPDALLLGYAITKDITLPAGKPYPAVVPSVGPDTPPTFLFTTGEDAVVPVAHSLAFAAALDEAGVNFELHVFQDGPHGLGLGRPQGSDPVAAVPVFSEWFGLSVHWLRTRWS